MDRKALLKQLDKATDKAAAIAVRKGTPLVTEKKGTLLGNTIIQQNIKRLYDILDLDQSPLYKNIFVFDVAIIIAQRYNNGEFSTVRKILRLEEQYVKHYMDMMYYMNCYKNASRNKDFEKMYILEDKFQDAEFHAKISRNNISIFKRIR